MLSSDWAINQLQKISKQQPALVNQAMVELLENNPQLNWSIVVNSYTEGEISLGKAAELLRMHPFELRKRFLELGIPLQLGSSNEAEALAEVAAIRRGKSSK